MISREGDGELKTQRKMVEKGAEEWYIFNKKHLKKIWSLRFQPRFPNKHSLSVRSALLSS